jgi:hypothetical protein
MKTKLSILVMSLFIIQAASAQFRIGPKGGVNLVKVDGHPFSDQFRYAYHLGVFSEIVLSKKLSLQPEVVWNQYATTLDSNFKAVYENLTSSDQAKVKLNYLSVPLLLNYRLIGPIYLQAGPQFSILMNHDKKFLQNGADAFSQGDFAMVAGAQIRISKFYFTGRYNIGLNNINDIDEKDKWKSQAIHLSVGIAL